MSRVQERPTCPGCGQLVDLEPATAAGRPALSPYRDRAGSTWHAGCAALRAVGHATDPDRQARVKRNRRVLGWSAAAAMVAASALLGAPGPSRWVGFVLWVVAGWTLIGLLVSRRGGA